MFIEPENNKGWIEVICGSMFSGKTEELIRRIRRAQIADQRTILFKPQVDQRYHQDNIVSHDQRILEAIPLSSENELLQQVTDHQVVGIDEAQFFGENLPNVVHQLANRGVRVIVAGLDLDYKAEPFGPMPYLIAKAEFVTKVHAICHCCGSLAQFTYRISRKGDQLELGETDKYEARCRPCYIRGMEGSNPEGHR